MNQIRLLVNQLIAEQALLQGTLSHMRSKNPEKASKVQIKPVMLKGQLQYQLVFTVGPKVLHENLTPEAAGDQLVQLLQHDFKQALFQAKDADYQILANKPDRATILKKPASKKAAQIELSHNRIKNYLLTEGEPVSFLVELGVMNAQGKVLAAKYDKFRQINRFLEMIDDITPYLSRTRRLKIIDFGCGKSYLTFALYHYLVHMQKLDVQMIGLDLKADVIAHCSQLAQKLGFKHLQFQVGDINRYNEAEQVDMVVTLHACDTATDAALEKAVRWGADVILSVPCCQHELFGQVQNSLLSPMLKHGIIKERFAALATDSLRTQLLELVGYKTQIIEFIDMEHTPKNLLIRAVKQTAELSLIELNKKAAEYLAFKQF
ncbi:MAG: SAM-dependent methyltransferase, partial [Bacilli bacterium]|nr:SAM-dependent methyltransferase [Bacilli bacterium]